MEEEQGRVPSQTPHTLFVPLVPANEVSNLGDEFTLCVLFEDHLADVAAQFAVFQSIAGRDARRETKKTCEGT